MEILDLYDSKGNKLNKTIIRNQEGLKGEYHLVVFIIIENIKGEYLIQKRASAKSKWPNMWAFTGGAVQKDEESESAALRELKEELGINLNKGELIYSHRDVTEDYLRDTWYCQVDVEIEYLVLQEEEVSGVAYKKKSQIVKMIKDKIFMSSEPGYLEKVFNIGGK